MILLGVLSQYTWGGFLTGLFIIDAIVLGIGFALNKFVWSRDAGLTKNDQRNLREKDEKDDVDRDYRKLNESVSDYNEVKSVDDSFDDEGDDEMELEEDYTPSTSRVAEGMYEEETEDLELPQTMTDDEESENVTQEDIEENNSLAQSKFLIEQDDCEVVHDEDFDADVRGGNMEMLDDEDSDENYASQHRDEELTDIVVKQGEGEFVGFDSPMDLDEDEDATDLMGAQPKDVDDAYPTDEDNMEDPSGDSEPDFPNE